MFIFDFDGVLIDSVDEAAVTAYSAASGSLATSLTDLPDGYLELFKNSRPFPRNASEMLVLGRWCLEKIELNEPATISREILEHLVTEDDHSESDLRRLFFETRQQLATRSPLSWLELNRPYQPLFDWLKTELNAPLVILTHKNRLAVEQICRHFGLEIRSDRIYSGDTGEPKELGLLAIMERFDSSSYHFIDDSIHNLLELKYRLPADADVSLELASWGYCTIDDVTLAEQEGLRVLALCEITTYIDNAIGKR